MKKNILKFLFLITINVLGQNMSEGFTYLETGSFDKAESFFKNILLDFPKNKTAIICFGRATGLNGNPTNAQQIFTKLLQTYPNDYEVKLNYAESLLWNQKFKTAENYYQQLIQENNQSFAALLGYANTLSNLKKYPLALKTVNKALEVSPNNPGAMISKKYIYLGLANQYAQKRHYNKAIDTLQKNLELFENDPDTLMNLANIYLQSKKYIQAKNMYLKMSRMSNLFFFGHNGLSLLAHLENDNQEALKISIKTINSIRNNTSKRDIQNTKTRYIQSLIWNQKYKEAKKSISNIKPQNEEWVYQLKAMYNTYVGDFKHSIMIADSILALNPKSFDGHLGKANALKANHQLKKSYIKTQEALTHFPDQKDILQLKNTIELILSPETNIHTAYSIDNGKSESYHYKHYLDMPINTKTALNGLYEYQNASNSLTDNQAQTHHFGLGFSYQISPKIKISNVLGILKLNAPSIHTEIITTDFQIKTQPYLRQELLLGFKRELQNFNAELIQRNIVQNHVYVNYNINTLFKLGWFTQLFQTYQTDQNQRNLIFTSLYYNLWNKPLLKTGINYQYLSFKNQVPTQYFSPNQFNAVEVFIDFIKDKNQALDHRLYYATTLAFGYQFVENDKAKSAYRLQSTIGYKFNKRCFLEGYYLRSNIASVATNVFTFNQLGIKFQWKLSEKPLFKI